MKNKQVKQMIEQGICDYAGIDKKNIFWDGAQVMYYEPPCGYSEGDEYPFYWYHMYHQITSLTANQLKSN